VVTSAIYGVYGSQRSGEFFFVVLSVGSELHPVHKRSLIMLDESIISLAQAARETPTRPDVSTVWRWSLRGIQGVTLETCLIGGKRCTSREALQRFHERVNAIGQAASVPSRSAAIAKAEKQADALGI
jgi:hypothetical protein